MNDRENRLRAYRFQGPRWIPLNFGINAACLHHYPRAELERLVETHESLFPQLKEGWRVSDLRPTAGTAAREPYRDPWGCLWETHEDGITGVVTDHPLADDAAFVHYVPPDPVRSNGFTMLDWTEVRQHIEAQRTRGKFISTGVHHGFFFLRMTYLRGYETLMIDLAEDSPQLHRMIAMVEDFSAEVVRRVVGLNVDMFKFQEDLGGQHAPLISPDMFRRCIKPTYQRLMALPRRHDQLVYLHCDGHILDLADDLIDAGVQVLNCQDLIHGIDNLARHLKGRVAIELDIDRQQVTRFGTPRDIHNLIREAVAKLDSPEGGLSLQYGLYPGVPLENAAAVMDAMVRYAER